MKGMNKKELKKECCFEYEFLIIEPLFETIDLITIQAGSEEDAFNLLEDEKTNYSIEVLLTEKMKKKLKELLK